MTNMILGDISVAIAQDEHHDRAGKSTIELADLRAKKLKNRKGMSPQQEVPANLGNKIPTSINSFSSPTIITTSLDTDSLVAELDSVMGKIISLFAEHSLHRKNSELTSVSIATLICQAISEKNSFLTVIVKKDQRLDIFFRYQALHNDLCSCGSHGPSLAKAKLLGLELKIKDAIDTRRKREFAEAEPLTILQWLLKWFRKS